MRQKNIDKEIKDSIVSMILNMIFRIAIIFIWIAKFQSEKYGLLFSAVMWTAVIILGIQTLFLPYGTWTRIKEIKKGELYEACKY